MAEQPALRFVLASASPARLATLRSAGLDPHVVVSGVDEDAVTADTPVELVQRLAELKAAAVARTEPDALVLGCDSLLELDGEPLGKPGSPEASRARWQQMRGRTGVLHTGHSLVLRGGTDGNGATVGRAASTTVHFADVSDTEILAYTSTGEPDVVAGAFTLDGLGGWFVDAVEGDPHNVVGVSLPLVRTLLAELGLDVTDLGYPARRP